MGRTVEQNEAREESRNQLESLRAEVARLRITDASWDRMKQENAHLQAKLLKLAELQASMDKLGEKSTVSMSDEELIESVKLDIVKCSIDRGKTDCDDCQAEMRLIQMIESSRKILAAIPSADRLEEMADFLACSGDPTTHTGDYFDATMGQATELRTLAKTVKENVCGK